MDPLSPPPTTARPADPTLRARGVDDLLGYAGHVLGTLPARSLLVLTVEATLLRAVVRVDLPPAPARAGREWAEAVAAVARRDRRADAVVLLVLDPSGPGLPAWWPPLAEALAAAGLAVREGWAVADGWARPWPVPGGPEPADGCGAAVPVHPQVSDLSLTLMTHGSPWGFRDDDARVPARARAHRAPWPVAGLARRTPDPAWLAAWEEVLTVGPTPTPADARLPALGAPLVLPAWRDRLLLTAACGAAGVPPSGAERARVLTAASPGPPDWRRLDRLWAALRVLAAVAPDAPAAQALALAGWVAWCRGQGRAAAAHLEAAAALAPAQGFVRVMGRVVATGAVAAWAADPARAWRPGAPEDGRDAAA